MPGRSEVLLHTFKVEVTPPIGHYLCGGLHQTAVDVETPLYLRGLVLSAGGTRCVIAGIDFCYLAGRSYQRLVDALAEGAGVPASHATLHANHVHDAPLIDEEAHARLEEFSGVRVHDEGYFQKVIRDTREAVKQAAARPGTRIGAVSLAQHPVERFASARRVLDAAGKCHVRWSVCRDEWVRSQPEGRIDRMLDQIVLLDEAGAPAACLNFYACHPQVSDGRRMISSDTVGVATDLFEQINPGVPCVHFDGCGGDITAGKYTTTNRPRNRLVFGVRLFDAMQGAFEKRSPAPLDSIGWIDHVTEVPLSRVTQSERELMSQLQDREGPLSGKYLAAMKLDRLRRPRTSYPFRVSRLHLGEISILFLPTELVLDYQLQAKSLMPGKLAVAAYGDSFLKYVAIDRHFDEGGYEVDPLWTEVQKGVERPIREAITRVLTHEALP